MKKEIYNKLDELDIKYKILEHDEVFTADEFYAVTKEMPGHHCKNLFLKNSNKSINYLVVAKHDKAVNLKEIKLQIGSSRLSFDSPEKLYELMKVTPGSVNPFSIINDTNSVVEVLIDNDLLDGQNLNFHPAINTETFNISGDDFIKFLDYIDNNVIKISI
ncbi:MAG: prolyl-tRNA synthetase associated domain-containing protein [Paraclostridium bifermentans]|uniref:prolyl-tRNA synthetase associated domain-containing protein n=1 Tax=Paraclostridium bifermentans TaxID=1490 RepID=UPI0011DDD451|nr:prolyl-tRNA synthetase associated domain-containing protein [Paraclostridium bifermentans]MBS6507886.1 prolyl-tRNA synthetase associated domain-containing protein [Paraclostridium bifermentans]MDU3803187.1 prolyl-tRNA synthetase associated domain-containing protein [Paraclostridium bifermentans]